MRARAWIFLAALTASAHAQPDGRDHRRPPPPVHDHRGDAAEPTEAPPPPREEPTQPRAGFAWIRGRWDWKAGKWDWVPGHWERERAGKKWREDRWEQQDGHWKLVAGDWVDAGAAAPPPVPPPVAVPPPAGEAPVPPPGPGPEVRDHRHEWKLERPTVSSYWPTKGKAGTRVTVRGLNFPTDAKVMFGGNAVLGAMISPEKIVFEIPKDATASGDIAIDRGHGRPLAVGTFDVAAGVDPEADAKRLDDERRRQAETHWADRQKQLAKDRAAREAEIQRHEQELETSRDQRREQRAAEIRAKWDAAFLADPDTQDELTLHAKRVADLQRMKEMAELSADAKLGVRIDLATQREQDRHDQRMKALHDGFKMGGAK